MKLGLMFGFFVLGILINPAYSNDQHCRSTQASRMPNSMISKSMALDPLTCGCLKGSLAFPGACAFVIDDNCRMRLIETQLTCTGLCQYSVDHEFDFLMAGIRTIQNLQGKYIQTLSKVIRQVSDRLSISQ